MMNSMWPEPAAASFFVDVCLHVAVSAASFDCNYSQVLPSLLKLVVDGRRLLVFRSVDELILSRVQHLRISVRVCVR